MATKTTSAINTTTGGSAFPVVISDIEDAAYKMQYENALLRHLFKPVGQGQKGGRVHYAYFNPTTFAAAASSLVEADDFVNYTQLTNSSVIIVASEFGVTTLLKDVVTEMAGLDINGELARQQGISVAVKLDKHCMGALSGGITTGTITGTNATNGFSFTSYGAVKQNLESKALAVPDQPIQCVVPANSWYYTAKSTYSQTYASIMGDPGDSVTKRWFVARILGNVDVYQVSTNLIAASSTAPGYAFVRDAVGIWIPRDFRLEKQRDASERGDEVISTMRAGAKVLIGSYGVRLKLKASAVSTT